MPETLHQIKLRHKAELKALQAKSVKGKGAKQQLRNEEQKLIEQHNHEIAAYHASQSATQTDDPTEQKSDTIQSTVQPKLAEQIASMSLYNLDKQPTLSAKQLKKQRKQQAEQQRLEQIRTEVSQMSDQRSTELTALNNKLQQLHCTVKQITADGNCMFAAVADQLTYIDTSKLYTQYELRELAAQYIQSHSNEFEQYIINDDNSKISVEEYCKQLTDKSNVQWGTHTELVALSAALQRPITVYTANNPPLHITHSTVKHSTNDTIRLSYHEHYYTLGQHYNSVVPKDSDIDYSYEHVEHDAQYSDSD